MNNETRSVNLPFLIIEFESFQISECCINRRTVCVIWEKFTAFIFAIVQKLHQIFPFFLLYVYKQYQTYNAKNTINSN